MKLMNNDEIIRILNNENREKILNDYEIKRYLKIQNLHLELQKKYIKE